MSGSAGSTRVLQLCYTLLNCRPRLSAGTTSNRSYDHSALAQLVEQLTVNQRVAGSSPAGGAISILQNPHPKRVRELISVRTPAGVRLVRAQHQMLLVSLAAP